MWRTIPLRMCIVLYVILTGGIWKSWYAVSAQPQALVLPTEFQGLYVMSKMVMHFCENEWVTCAVPSECVRWICCGGNSNQCSNNTDPSMCMEDGQVWFCGYRDAIVCQYEDGRGSCIYSISSMSLIKPLCVCKENDVWPTSHDQTSQIRRSCTGNETTTGSSGSSSGLSTAISPMNDQTESPSGLPTTTSPMNDQTESPSGLPTTTSPMSDQTESPSGQPTTTSPMSDQTESPSGLPTTTSPLMSDQTESPSGLPTTTSPMSDQTESPSGQPTLTTSPMSDQTTEARAPQKSESSEVNTIAIVLGAILVIVLLVLLVVCLLKRRRNQTTPKKATTNTTNASVVSSAERAQIPEPLVLGGVDYNYAYDQWPQSNTTSYTGEPKPVNHTGGNRDEKNEPSGSSSIAAGNMPDIRELPKYYELGQPQDGSEGGETPQGPKYYELGQAIDAATSQENLQGPKFYELGQSCDAAKGGKTPQVPKYDEVRRRPHTEQIINEKTPHDPQHFVLEQSRDAANGGKTPQAPKYDEVRRRPHTEQRNIVKTPQDPKYFELEHPQDNDNETMFIEVDESVNPSPGGSSNQGYDQAYMPLKQSAKPVDSGYEPLQMPSSVAERNNAPSAYDHLNNKTGIRLQKVTPSEKDCDDQYASLNV